MSKVNESRGQGSNLTSTENEVTDPPVTSMKSSFKKRTLLRGLWATVVIFTLASCTTYILEPQDQTLINKGEKLTLKGEVRSLGVSQEEATAKIIWKSSLSGELGAGAMITTDKLTAGLHEITAQSEKNISEIHHVFVDDTAPQCWAKISEHPVNHRFKHTTFVLKGKLWVMGGVQNTDFYMYPRSDMKLDFWLSTNGVFWEKGPSEINHNPAGAKSVVYEDQALVTGGGFSMVPFFEFISHQNYRYNDDLSRGVQGVFLPERRDHVMMKFQKKLWLIGGFGGAADPKRSMGWTNEKLRRDVLSSIDGHRWVETESSFDKTIPWEARQGHAGVVFKDKMWILGGRTMAANGLFSASNDIWNTTDGETWKRVTTKGKMWGPRAWHSAVVYKNRLYVIGGLSFIARGTTPDHAAWQDVWVTDDGKKWEKLHYAKGCDVPALYGHSATVMNDRIYLVGGYNPSLNRFSKHIRSFRVE